MKLYELINPSDKYTFYAPNIEVAGCCAMLLSYMFSAVEVTDEGNAESSPAIWGHDEWMKQRGINEDWIDEHSNEIAEAFESFVISDRSEYEESIKYMSPENVLKYKAERQDRQRSSMNQIGERAYEYAKRFRERAQKEQS